MKNIMYKLNLFLFFIVAVVMLQSCQNEEETYPEPPKRLFISQALPVGTTRLSVSATGKKTVATVTFRVIVNKHYDTDVTATYTISGTATAGVDFTDPTSKSVVIPAGSYWTDVPITILNNPTFTTGSRTVIVTLNDDLTTGFMAGLGYKYMYKAFTYTITP